MNKAELQEELTTREKLMQKLRDRKGVWTDQWRVYQEIVTALGENTAPLRLFLQASAGTGKSFLLETVFIWCALNGHCAEAAAPTGIAAARLRVNRMPVFAYTLHYLFGLSVDLESRVDPSKPDDETCARLTKATVMIIDEASMMDDAVWRAIKDQLTTVGALRLAAGARRSHPPGDDYGRVHLILACDYKQLPPASDRPPFIAADPQLLQTFDFRVLRQNRRLASGSDAQDQDKLERFHETLEDIAFGRPTRAARDFLVGAYLRGASTTQATVGFEGSTACFTRRRDRNRWNKKVLERSAAKHKRALKVKAVFLARGTQSGYLRTAAAQTIARQVRNQSLVTLRLAGQWLDDPPIGGADRPHCMRAMLVANMDVPNGFANGAVGRVVHWGSRCKVSDEAEQNGPRKCKRHTGALLPRKFGPKPDQDPLSSTGRLHGHRTAQGDCGKRPRETVHVATHTPAGVRTYDT